MTSVVIVGAGALGGLLAYRLTTKADVNVAVIVGKSSHSNKVVENHGIKLTLPGDVPKFRSVVAYRNSCEVPKAFCDNLSVIVVATKANTTGIGGLDVVVDLVRRAPKNVVVVPLLNTLVAYELIVQVVSDVIVLPGLAIVSTFVSEPGIIEVVKHLELLRIEIGPAEARQHKDVLESICTLLQCEGVSVTQVVDGMVALWKKCVLTTAAGVVAAACGVPCFEAAKYQSANELSMEVAKEMCMVAKAEGVELDVKFTRESALKLFKPEMLWSIQRDLLMNRPCELDAQLGTFVRRAEREGVEVPTLRFLYAVLLPRAMVAEKRDVVAWPVDVKPMLPGNYSVEK